MRIQVGATKWIILILYFYYAKNYINASMGDRSPYFRQCISICTTNHGCPFIPNEFPWWYREQCFRCRQECVWHTVEVFHKNGYATPQFYGKWPFIPIVIRSDYLFFAIQEPASVAFSLLNAITMWMMMQRFKNDLSSDWYCVDVWKAFGNVGMLTWFASILFHCCDHLLTEMLDYCGAFALVLYTFYASLCFVLPAQHSPLNRKLFLWSVGIALSLFYVHYIYSMYSTPRFDYGFHVRCCVQIALATGLLYSCWVFFELWNGRARHSMLILGAVFCVGWLSAAFDAFLDFPPIFWTFDAHSMFHLISMPVPLLWAEFICQEANRVRVKTDQKAK